MSLVAGTATASVDANGNVTTGGTGLAAAIAAQTAANDLFWSDPAAVKKDIDVLGVTMMNDIFLKSAIVAPANALAAAIVGYFTANAVVSVPNAATGSDTLTGSVE